MRKGGQQGDHLDLRLVYPEYLQRRGRLGLSTRYFPKNMCASLGKEQREESGKAETSSESGIRKEAKTGKAYHYLKLPLRLYGGGGGEMLISGSD